MRVCGLKLMVLLLYCFLLIVTPYAGVWIETNGTAALLLPT